MPPAPGLAATLGRVTRSLERDPELVAALEEERRAGPGSPVRVLYAGVWLIFLYNPMSIAVRTGHFAALAAMVVFVVGYLLFWARWGSWIGAAGLSRPIDLVALVGCGALAVLLTFWLGQEATQVWVYVVVMLAARFSVVTAATLVLALVAVHEVLSRTLSGWTPDEAFALSVVLAAGMVIATKRGIQRRVELEGARVENRRLAIQAERDRLARDVHDILGHSLTVITVKSELAGRLLEDGRAPALARARAEVGDVELLARSALADVRQTVAGYREMSLAGEIAAARTALEAAQIEPDLPNSVDDVAPDLRTLFAWAVREGVTNVIRHSGARHCAIVLARGRLEVIDDGRGVDVEPEHEPGHGLAGLRKRAADVGAVVRTGRVGDPPGASGFRLVVERAA